MTDFKKLYEDLVLPGRQEFLSNVRRALGSSDDKSSLKDLEAAALKFWQSQPENQVYKSRPKPTKTKGPQKAKDPAFDYCIQFDLMDMTRIKRFNRNYCWILTAIEARSRHCWAYPVKLKQPALVAEAFRQILDQLPAFSLVKLVSDQGNEFEGSFKTLIGEYRELKHMTIVELKNSVTTTGLPKKYTYQVERFNQTILLRLRKLFVRNNNEVWIDHLESITNNYNKDKTLPAPRTVVKIDLTPSPTNLKVGDTVRIKQQRGIFDKKTLAKPLSVKQYKVVSVNNSSLGHQGIELDDGKTYEARELEVTPEADGPPNVVIEQAQKEQRANKTTNKLQRLQRRSNIKPIHEVAEIKETGEVVFKPRLQPAAAKRVPKPSSRLKKD